MGQSSSSSNTNTTNITSTSTQTIANAFNNALNTTQNFSNIGAIPAQAGSTFGDFNYTLIFGAIAAVIAFFVLMKRH